MKMRSYAAVGLALSASFTAAACPLTEPRMQREGVQASWRVDGPAIDVGRPFVMEVQLCPADAVLERADATMPEHRHGMNYRPSAKPLGDGRWRVEGMAFHMPGKWELRLDVRVAGRAERLLDTIILK